MQLHSNFSYPTYKSNVKAQNSRSAWLIHCTILNILQIGNYYSEVIRHVDMIKTSNQALKKKKNLTTCDDDSWICYYNAYTPIFEWIPELIESEKLKTPAYKSVCACVEQEKGKKLEINPNILFRANPERVIQYRLGDSPLVRLNSRSERRHLQIT